MIEFEINDKKIKVQQGATIIEAADSSGIYIPRFCYHKKLSIVANCRMCLVDVEKSRKPLPACATPVTPGMQVYTTTRKALEAQRAVMEFLLINHPLDCPICDQGGECELQDLAMGYGNASSYYDGPKRAVFSNDLGPLIQSEMTRCIQCTRCVRFGEEIAGLRELGALGRGEQLEIGTYIRNFMKSELSGNIIDLCPVGALTAKPASYQGRGFEYHEHPSVAPHDCVGSNLFIHSRGQEYLEQRRVMRVVPRENELINENWLSDRDRFSYQGLYHKNRLYEPQVKRNKQWVSIGWRPALLEIVHRTQAVLQEQGANKIGGLSSSQSTVEEFYLFQKLLRGLGSSNIDHRIREQDFTDQKNIELFPNLGIAISEVEKQSAILLIGSDVRFEQPIISHRINKASAEGAKIMALNSIDSTFTFPLFEKIIAHPNTITNYLLEIIQALGGARALNNNTEIQEIHTSAENIAIQLKTAEQAVIWMGEHAIQHPESNRIRAFMRLIAKLSNARYGELSSGPNSAGAYLAGVLPHRCVAGSPVEESGLHAKALLTTDSIYAYYLLNFEPEFDCMYAAAALKSLRAARLVVCFSYFITDAMKEYADFILPITPYTETGGTFINVEGRWQTFQPVSKPEGNSKPAWKVLRALASALKLKNFNYKTVYEVHNELKKKIHPTKIDKRSVLSLSLNGEENKFLNTDVKKENNTLMRLAPWPVYRVDPLVRRADALQNTCIQTVLGQKHGAVIMVNTKTAKRLHLKVDSCVTAIQADTKVTLPLVISDRLADNTVWLPCGLKETAGFGCGQNPITLWQPKLHE